MKLKGKIVIVRTEQWEHTAYYVIGKKTKLSATGYSERDAEVYLLRKLVFGTDKKEPTIDLYGGY